ncbi:hypothetical protein [Actinoplanes flavus]|uniref:DUF4352 domain-containing protein n=1 Tax=Actinoplanes flavus TaxID=2820290 RepID=A0ABS3UIX5_9ACTN|nr:hypothetical protein [Actinoplanes flavus]MBO3738735.1 hypothetical protein [Actinoplanes flavus]
MSYPPPYQPPPTQGYPMPPQPGFPAGPGAGRPSGGRRAALLLAGVAAVVTVGLVALTDDTGTGEATTASTQATRAGTAEALQAGPGREESATGTPAETFGIPVGSVITHRDGGDVVTAVARSVKTYRQGCNSLDVDPEQGLYVVVDVLVTQSRGRGSVNPLDFTFVAEDGTSANALSAAFSGCDDPALAAADLRSGQKRAGKIAFDTGMKSGTVEWAPGGLGADTVGSWRIP